MYNATPSFHRPCTILRNEIFLSARHSAGPSTTEYGWIVPISIWAMQV